MTDTTFLHKMVKQYGCSPVHFAGNERAWYEHHLVFDHVVKPEAATPRQQFEAIACSVRDLLTPRWLKTQTTHDRANPKRVYYLSMEFLIGRSLVNNITNLQIESLVNERVRGKGLDWRKLADQEEPDAGLGNGGLGRLAACFIDSLATLQIPAIGYGLRYQYGMFRQEILKRLPGRASRQLAASSRSVGGDPPIRKRRSADRLLLRPGRRRSATHPQSP